MKNKGNSLAVLGILFLLGCGYCIPTAILAMEDEALKQNEKNIAIEEIQLNTSTVNIEEQLQVFPDMIFEHIVIEIDKDEMEVENSMIQADLEHKDNIEEYIYDFWQIFRGEELIFEKFICSNYVMMTGLKNDNMYSIWECVGVDKEGNNFYFWMDDMTGKILAFDIPFWSFGNEEDYYLAMNKLSDYYGFQSYGFVDQIQNFYKMKSWENGLILYDEQENVKLTLGIYKVGDRLYFNIYPGTKKISSF